MATCVPPESRRETEKGSMKTTPQLLANTHSNVLVIRILTMLKSPPKSTTHLEGEREKEREREGTV